MSNLSDPERDPLPEDKFSIKEMLPSPSEVDIDVGNPLGCTDIYACHNHLLTKNVLPC